MAEEKRLLVTKIERSSTETGGKPVCEMWIDNPKLRFPELRLFDLSRLLLVGIDPNDLDEGKTRFCRFWAIYIEIERQTQSGTPYRDIVRLEPALPEEDDQVAELLREQVAIFGRIEALLQAAIAPREERARAPAAPTTPVTQPETAMQPEPEPSHTEPERPVLDEDMARKRFSRDAGPAIRNDLLDASFVNELTKQVSAGALSWRSALGQLQEQIARS